jgi:hypothetical protein
MKRFLLIGAAALWCALTLAPGSVGAMPLAPLHGVGKQTSTDTIHIRGHGHMGRGGRGNHYGWSRGRHRGWR